MAETPIAELGVDMGQYPTCRLTSWAGICPGNEESAGKCRSGKTRKGSKWLCSALTKSARAAARSKGAYLARNTPPQRPTWFRKSRRGGRASILMIAYHVLEREVPYEELGEDYLHRQRSGEAYAKRLVRSCSGSVTR